jgi:hypothetical protein
MDITDVARSVRGLFEGIGSERARTNGAGASSATVGGGGGINGSTSEIVYAIEGSGGAGADSSNSLGSIGTGEERPAIVATSASAAASANHTA